MKINDAPEKIWVHELSAMELDVPFKAYHVEYTRTDAFIKKACNWLEQSLEPYIPYCNIDIDLVIEKFKIYMEG